MLRTLSARWQTAGGLLCHVWQVFKVILKNSTAQSLSVFKSWRCQWCQSTVHCEYEMRPDTSRRQQRHLPPCPPPWSLPWCPWNAPVRSYNFLIGCPSPRRKCLGALTLSKTARHISSLSKNWVRHQSLQCKLNVNLPGNLFSIKHYFFVLSKFVCLHFMKPGPSDSVE